MAFFRKRERRGGGGEIYPDEIFLDSKNLPEFNVHQMEGRIEQPITKWSVGALGIAFVTIAVLFSARAVFLQIVQGNMYRAKAEANRLDNVPIFSRRGIIYDRNGKELAWNVATEISLSTISAAAQSVTAVHATSSLTEASSTKSAEPYIRSYIRGGGFGHLLGYVSYPLRDSKGFYYQTFFEGKTGIEALFDKTLNGTNGTRMTETDALGHIAAESVVEPPKDGANLALSIDADVQAQLYKAIRSLAETSHFTGGAGVVMDVRTGEILALTNYPEYDPEVLSLGDDTATIKGYLTGAQKPLLDRALAGLYTPGSIVKPFLAIGALEEGVIDPNKKILSTGSISIPNPYDPKLSTIFRDWRVNGWTDMRQALAVSSDVYFYEIGGGYKNEQRGMGIGNIKKYSEMFGIGEPTGIALLGEPKGVIPSPEWKAKNFSGEPWRLGDTYHTAVGQYGFQVTPLQMVRAMAALANGGTLLTPQIVKGAAPVGAALPLHQENLTVVKEGMRQAVVIGTAQGVSFLDLAVAAKTGTAELGAAKKYVNSWTMGFFPYDNPKYAFVTVMEKGPSTNAIGATSVMRQVLDWMRTNRPEDVK